MKQPGRVPGAADSDDGLVVLNEKGVAEMSLWLQEAHWNLLVELQGAGEIECRPHEEWVETARCLGKGREILRFLLPVQTAGDYCVRLALVDGGPVKITNLRLDTPGLEPRNIKAGEVRQIAPDNAEVSHDDRR